MTDQELLEIESALAQYRSALREVGNTANMQAATEEVLVVATWLAAEMWLVAEVRRLNALVDQRGVRIYTPEETLAMVAKAVREVFEAKSADVVEVAK